MPRGKKPSNLDRVFNLRRWREFRHRAGLSLRDVQAATGIRASNLSAFELGHLVLQFHKIQELILLYRLDAFEVLELLRIRILDPSCCGTSAGPACATTPLRPRPCTTLCWSSPTTT